MSMSKKDLAIAYSVKRKNAKKRMADSAKAESRPMPSETADDSHMVSQNDHMRSNPMDKMTDQPERAQVKPKRTTPIKYPKMVGSDAFSVRLHNMRDEEDDMISSMPPKKMAKGGEVKDTEAIQAATIARPDNGWGAIVAKAEGGMINKAVSMKSAEEDDVDHPDGLESDDDMMAPPVDEYMANRMAEGGVLDEEMEDEEHSSIAAAIMAKRRRMAEGGQVDIDENAEEQPNMYYRRNQEALKENYDSDMDDVEQPMDSNEMGHEEDDEHDQSIVGQIRRKMKTKSPMVK